MSTQDTCVADAFDTLTPPIALFGGSFDPVHLGHLEIARSVVKKLRLGSLVFVPTHQNPLKDSQPLATDQQRFNLLQTAIKEEQKLFVSPIELQLQGESGGEKTPTYTIDTVRNIRRQIGPKATLYFVFGSELIEQLWRWKDIATLFSLCTMAPIVRAGYPTPDITERNTNLNARHCSELAAHLLQVPPQEISSTTIRDNPNPKTIHASVPESIAAAVGRIYGSGRLFR